MVRKKKKTESSMWQRLPYEVAPSGESVSKLVKEINRAIYEGEKIDVGRVSKFFHSKGLKEIQVDNDA